MEVFADFSHDRRAVAVPYILAGWHAVSCPRPGMAGRRFQCFCRGNTTMRPKPHEQALRHERAAKRATSAGFGRGDHGRVPLRRACRSCRPFGLSDAVWRSLTVLHPPRPSTSAPAPPVGRMLVTPTPTEVPRVVPVALSQRKPAPPFPIALRRRLSRPAARLRLLLRTPRRASSSHGR